MTGEVVSYSGPGPGESKTAEHPAGNEIEEGRRSCSPPSSPRRCPFQIHVDVDQLGRIAGTSVLDSPGKSSLGRRSIGSGSFMGVRKRTHLHNKTAEEVERIVQAGKVRELKNCIRNHHWLPFDCVRSRLWQVFERNFVDYNYFSLNSYLRCRSSAVFTSRIKLQWIRCTGTRSNRFTGLTVWIYFQFIILLIFSCSYRPFGAYSDLVTKTGPLPTFVEPSFQMSYYLNETGIQVARRVVNIISYSCPDITYAPSLYPITCLLLHYMSGISTLFLMTHLDVLFLALFLFAQLSWLQRRIATPVYRSWSPLKRRNS